MPGLHLVVQKFYPQLAANDHRQQVVLVFQELHSKILHRSTD